MTMHGEVKLVYVDVDGNTVAIRQTYKDGSTMSQGSKDKAVLCLMELPDGTREPLLKDLYKRHRINTWEELHNEIVPVEPKENK